MHIALGLSRNIILFRENGKREAKRYWSKRYVATTTIIGLEENQDRQVMMNGITPAKDDKFLLAMTCDDTNDAKARPSESLLPPGIAESVAFQFQESIKEMNNSSNFLVSEEDRNRDVAPFLKKEVVLGEHLASGCFSDVHEIRSFRQCNQHRRSLTDVQESARAKILSDLEGCYETASDDEDQGDEEKKKTEPVSLGSNKNAFNNNKYVVKHLRPRLMDDFHTFTAGAVDLGREAQFLASIQHPNIVNIRGWSSYGTSGYKSGHHDGYFLILDRLYETLKERNKYWRKQVKKVTLMPSAIQQKRQQMLVDRLKIFADIASALEYLHDRKLIYRDLKPNNLAFDIKGNIQIFDFGLAREIPQGTEDEGAINEVYNLSGGTGSLRYMAPEVAKHFPYNAKADVYGFALMLYESLSLRKPFEGFTSEMMYDKVFLNGARPKLFSLETSLPRNVFRVMTDGWAEDMKQRPTMKEVHSILRAAVVEQEALVGLTASTNGRMSRRSSLSGLRRTSLGFTGSRSNMLSNSSVDDLHTIKKGDRRSSLIKRGSCGF